jgi:hypothetical protein
MHAAFEHPNPCTQSLLVVHVVLHFCVVPSQTKLLSHAFAVPGAHTPWPSHAFVICELLAHEVPHAVFETGYEHAAPFVPSHVPPHVVPSPVHFGRVPCGAPVTGTQWPAWPVASHAEH